MNFFEAMKAADEGKVVVDYGGGRYKKEERSLLSWNWGGWHKCALYGDVIFESWTIEEPEPKLPEKTVDSLKGKNPVFFVVPLIRKFNALIDLAADLQKQIKELKGER